MFLTRLLRTIPRGVCPALTIGVIAYLTLFYVPAPEVGPQMFANADKVVHALMFGFLAWIVAMDALVRVPASNKRRQPRIVLLAAVFALVCGGAVELLQGACTTTRSAEWADLLADAAGVVVALPLLVCWLRAE